MCDANISFWLLIGASILSHSSYCCQKWFTKALFVSWVNEHLLRPPHFNPFQPTVVRKFHSLPTSTQLNLLQPMLVKKISQNFFWKVFFANFFRNFFFKKGFFEKLFFENIFTNFYLPTFFKKLLFEIFLFEIFFFEKKVFKTKKKKFQKSSIHFNQS